MENQLKPAVMFNSGIKTILMLVLLSNLYGCIKEADFSGFVRSDVRVNERFEQSMVWNQLHSEKKIKTDTNEYSINIAADLHIGGLNNFNTLISFSKYPDKIALFLAGDITTGLPEDYENLTAAIHSIDSVRIFGIAGNHDLYFKGWDNFYSLFGSSVYTLKIITPNDSDLYVFLDTGGGTLGNKQLAWLEEILTSQRPNFRYCVIITHCNFFRPRFSTSTSPPVEELRTITALFNEYDINMVITGHDHRIIEEIFGKTLYLTIDAAKDGYKKASYLSLSVMGDGLMYDFVEF